MGSKITQFYKNKTIFLTGGSGFLGKAVVEKLLRLTELKRIYILLRPKRGVDIQSRIENFKTDLLFSELIKINPNFVDKLTAISGDCEQPDLGLSDANRKLIIDEVQVVIHSAATVNFVERLSVALSINTRATHLIVELAKQMRRLEAFVHVSTAYSNCILEHINESFYPELLTYSADKILSLKEQMSEELMDSLSPTLLNKFPNTYTYTKALAEQVIQTEAADLPVCVFRPGMILPSYKGHSQGWIDNFYGPIALVFGCAMGVVHAILLNKDARTNIVPVDYCANLIIASAWRMSSERSQRKVKDVPIYNFVPTAENPITWSHFVGVAIERREIYPLEQMIWYPFIFICSSLKWYTLLTYIYHYAPGFLMDMVLRLKGQKPRMVKIYRKVDSQTKLLASFATQNWTFDMQNTVKLVELMSPQDRTLYEIDLSQTDWSDYMNIAMIGIRKYLAKEEVSEKAFKRGVALCKRLYVYNIILHVVVVSTFLFLGWSMLKLFI